MCKSVSVQSTSHWMPYQLRGLKNEGENYLVHSCIAIAHSVLYPEGAKFKSIGSRNFSNDTKVPGMNNLHTVNDPQKP